MEIIEAKFAGTCIIQDDKILLVQEAHKEARGLWSLTLGHVENDEKESETAIRETKEETGYDVVLGEEKKLKIKGTDFKSTSDFDNCEIEVVIFEARITGGSLSVGNDVLDTKWFPLNEVSQLPLRGKWVKDFFSIT